MAINEDTWLHGGDCADIICLHSGHSPHVLFRMVTTFADNYNKHNYPSTYYPPGQLLLSLAKLALRIVVPGVVLSGVGVLLPYIYISI